MSAILIPGAPTAPDQQPAPEAKKGVQPALWLEFHPESQSVEVHVNPEKVMTWDFARALLLMGQQAAERMAQVAMAKAAQHAAMEAQRAGMIADQVMRDVARPGRRH